MLPGLALREAAASRDTLIAVIVAVLAGGITLAPSLGLLFRLLLTGRFDHPSERAAAPVGHTPRYATAARGYARLALACALAGFVLLSVVEDGTAHVFGVLALIAATALMFRAVGPADLPNDAAKPTTNTSRIT
jgi:cytochrome d ubiquinol oxidase subunit II